MTYWETFRGKDSPIKVTRKIPHRSLGIARKIKTRNPQTCGQPLSHPIRFGKNLGWMFHTGTLCWDTFSAVNALTRGDTAQSRGELHLRGLKSRRATNLQCWWKIGMPHRDMWDMWVSDIKVLTNKWCGTTSMRQLETKRVTCWAHSWRLVLY